MGLTQPNERWEAFDSVELLTLSNALADRPSMDKVAEKLWVEIDRALRARKVVYEGK